MVTSVQQVCIKNFTAMVYALKTKAVSTRGTHAYI